MLKVAIFFTLTSLVVCHGLNWIGDYNQIMLNQSHPITKFWIIHKTWPRTKYNPLNLALSNGAWESLQTPSIWILNSFLPVKSDGNYLENCFNRVPDYSDVIISETNKTRLREEWPNYESKEYENSLWAEAWIKHGLCMSNLDEVGTPDKYISKSLALLRAYNIGALLEINGIVPGKSYLLEQIIYTIEESLQISVHLRCIVDKDSPKKEQYLSGANICLDNTFKLQNCIARFPASCSKKKNVFIPHIIS